MLKIVVIKKRFQFFIVVSDIYNRFQREDERSVYGDTGRGGRQTID